VRLCCCSSSRHPVGVGSTNGRHPVTANTVGLNGVLVSLVLPTQEVRRPAWGWLCSVQSGAARAVPMMPPAFCFLRVDLLSACHGVQEQVACRVQCNDPLGHEATSQVGRPCVLWHEGYRFPQPRRFHKEKSVTWAQQPLYCRLDGRRWACSG
jgi:hypothetical protein